VPPSSSPSPPHGWIDRWNQMQEVKDWMLRERADECASLRSQLERVEAEIQARLAENARLVQRIDGQSDRMRDELERIRASVLLREPPSSRNPTSAGPDRARRDGEGPNESQQPQLQPPHLAGDPLPLPRLVLAEFPAVDAPVPAPPTPAGTADRPSRSTSRTDEGGGAKRMIPHPEPRAEGEDWVLVETHAGDPDGGASTHWAAPPSTIDWFPAPRPRPYVGGSRRHDDCDDDDDHFFKDDDPFCLGGGGTASTTENDDSCSGRSAASAGLTASFSSPVDPDWGVSGFAV
jgi:hypothetical protein